MQCYTIKDALWCESDLDCSKHSIITAFAVTHPVLYPHGTMEIPIAKPHTAVFENQADATDAVQAASSKIPLISFHSNGFLDLGVKPFLVAGPHEGCDGVCR